jgi:hypothetical protein
MDLLVADLQKINDSLLLLGKSDDGTQYVTNIVIFWNRSWIYPLPVEQYLAGDCAWLSFCNGKESMSNHWCIYCPLSRSQFLVISGNHPIVNWTIALLTEMANDATKKGPARL